MVVRAVLGGALVGLAAATALLLNGRIAGVSGTLGRALDRDDGRTFRVMFLVGLIGTGVLACMFVPAEFGPQVRGLGGLAIGGALVGFGTTLGNGCTSGHGVCGIGRGSKRSLVAATIFMVTGMITVALMRSL
ncbi:MAG: YeeE/YedE thiosulfate transporter family protein [Kofleriaceae bacterium]